jgi:hypothetical protein
MSTKLKAAVGDLVAFLVTKNKFEKKQYMAPVANRAIGFAADGVTLECKTPATAVIQGAGTAYTVTATAAAVTAGTTSPVLPALAAGTYLITGTAVVNNVGATFAADRTITLKLRRTNNTAADLTGGSQVFGSGIKTTETSSEVVALNPTVYTTTNATDVVTLFADVSVIPTAGSLTVSNVRLAAVRIL